MRAPFCFILLYFTSFHFFTCVEGGLEEHHHHHHHHRDGTTTIKPKKKTQKRRHHRNKNKIPNNDIHIDKNKEEIQIGKAQKKRNENFYIFDEFDTLADRYVYVYFV